MAVVYIAVRSILVGNDYISNPKNRKKITVINILILSITVSAVNGVFNYIQYGEKYTGLFDGQDIVQLRIIKTSITNLDIW